MRIFLIWSGRSSGLEFKTLISKLNKYPNELVYWVGVPEKKTYSPKNTVFHSYDDAMVARPANDIDVSEFPPPDENLIIRLYKTESIVLTMMNRMFDRLCVDERRHIYYTMVRYWLGVLKKYRPELIIFPNTPHFVYNYIIYELAHMLNIKIIMFDDTRIPGRLLFYSDFQRGSDVLREIIKRNKEKNFTIDDLSDDLKKYYEARTKKGYNTIPDYIRDQQKKHSFIYWLLYEPKIRESIRNLTFFIKAPRYLLSVVKRSGASIIKKPMLNLSYLLRYNLKKEYKAVQSKPDLSKKFIYFPLQKQPERTTSPQGDMFVDQILALEVLSASLPRGWIIYTKEHPLQWLDSGLGFSSSRYKGYYKEISEIKNVYIVPVNENSFNLINKSQAVAAVTGSAGWEAVLRGVPAIIFGYVWYQDCYGIFKVNGVESCRDVLRKIAGGFRVDSQQVINYLRAFDDSTIHAFVSQTASKASGLTRQESMDNIAQLILKEVNNI